MNVAKYLIFIGVFLIFLGLFLLIFNKNQWFSNTFLDFKYISKNFKIYFPIGSMLVISLFITCMYNLYTKFFK